MARALILAALLASFTAGCQSTDPMDPEKIRELDETLLTRLDKLLTTWVTLQNSGKVEELGRTERKIRSLVDNHFVAIRLGLHSGSARKRAICAAAVGFPMDIGVVGELLGTLNDPSPEVRSNALLSLSRIAYKRIPLDALLPSLEDENPSVRRTAVLCLEKVSSVLTEERIVRELMGTMGDPDHGVRMNAAIALGRLGNVNAVELLADKGLSDKDDRVRYNAAIALAELKSYRGLEALIQAGKKEINEAVKREIARALRTITSEDFGRDFESWEKWWLDFKAKSEKKDG
jgi:hypothetical protein